ncbi:unnamed protein product [Lampetra planeri]
MEIQREAQQRHEERFPGERNETVGLAGLHVERTVGQPADTVLEETRRAWPFAPRGGFFGRRIRLTGTRQAGPSLDGAWMGDHCRTAKPQLDHHRLEMPPTWGGKSSRHRARGADEKTAARGTFGPVSPSRPPARRSVKSNTAAARSAHRFKRQGRARTSPDFGSHGFSAEAPLFCGTLFGVRCMLHTSELHTDGHNAPFHRFIVQHITRALPPSRRDDRRITLFQTRVCSRLERSSFR